MSKLILCYILIAVYLLGCSPSHSGKKDQFSIDEKQTEVVMKKLFKLHEDVDPERIENGVRQLAIVWYESDGSTKEFQKFCTDNFMADGERDENLERIIENIQSMRSHTSKIKFQFEQSGRFTDVKEIKADKFFESASVKIDPYENKLAFFIKLNFPHYSLEEKQKLGRKWSRKEWVMARLGDVYSSRKPIDFEPSAVKELGAWREYMKYYFVRMDHISMPDGSFPFTDKVSLHSHRGLRDNIKEEYTKENGTVRQQLSGKVIEHIVQGTVPRLFLEDSTVYWNPWKNILSNAEGKLVESPKEDSIRYAGLLSAFKNKSSADGLYQNGSTAIKRNFDNHNIKQKDVEQLIRDFLSNPIMKTVGKVVEKKLKRPLEPFDIWYSGFQAQAVFDANVLDSITKTKYPDPLAFQTDISQILINIGFPETDANHLGSRITVRPVPSGGYAMRPVLKDDDVVFTTIFGKQGLDYKSYRVGLHELGHAVEMVYTSEEVDYPFLAGVPNNGITEGIAELLAYRNIEGLGLEIGSPKDQKHLQALAAYWYLVEMAGQALTDIETWKWMYAHPKASPEELREAVLSISEDIWNTYYAQVFHVRDQHILSIYNHFITGGLYLYNYFLSNLAMFQLYDAFDTDISEGLKKACAEGNTLPELWMERAVGESLSTEPILVATRNALVYFQE